jgi:hypothetical protein
MNQNKASLVLGITFLVLGILGFAPSVLSLPPVGFESGIPLDPTIYPYAEGFGYLFGIFPTNLMHNLFHITVGLFGIAASGDRKAARSFNRIFAASYAVIVVMGFLPYTKTFFGMMPLFGNNIWFNALTAVFAGYYGFGKSEPTELNVY